MVMAVMGVESGLGCGWGLIVLHRSQTLLNMVDLVSRLLRCGLERIGAGGLRGDGQTGLSRSWAWV